MNDSKTNSCCCDPLNKINVFLQDVVEKMSCKGFVRILFQLISFVGVVICVFLDKWLSGSYGNQGLWSYCINNEGGNCCADIYDVIEQQGFIDVTKGCLVIECLLFLAAIVLSFLFEVKLKETEHKSIIEKVSLCLWIIIVFCSLLSMSIYGAKYKDVSKDQSLSGCYILCVLNFVLQFSMLIYEFLVKYCKTDAHGDQ